MNKYIILLILLLLFAENSLAYSPFVAYTETANTPYEVIDKYETMYKTENINVKKPLIYWILGLE